MALLKKHLSKTIFILFLTIFAFLIAPVPAQANDFNDARLSPDMNLESFISGKLDPTGPSGLMPIVAKSLTSMAIGSYDDQGNPIAYGGTSIASILIGGMYQTQPISSKQYLAYSLKNIGFAPPAYAIQPTQGSDFFEPFIDIWKAFRNIAYVFFIIIFVVVGFMIMFRSKLNPQTTVNLQLALPRIIISLILVTFSYAISGLIVDLALLGNKLISNILGSIGSVTSSHIIKLPEEMDLIGGLLRTGASWGGLDFLQLMADLASNFLSFISGLATGDIDTKVLFTTILAFTIFGTVIKIFFTLFTKYVTLLLQAVFSPFVFLYAALPSGGQSVASYFKSMISAALAFPATYLFFELSSYIVEAAEAGNLALRDLPPLNSSYGTPYLLDTITSPSATGGSPVPVGLALFTALGILMIIPSIPQAIDKALGAGSGLGAASADFGGALKKIPLVGSLIG